MSVLHSRIMAQGSHGPQAHPYGTAATPMVMPISVVTYGADEHALYGQLHPIYTTDGAVIAGEPHAQVAGPEPAPVIPAGRP